MQKTQHMLVKTFLLALYPRVFDSGLLCTGRRMPKSLTWFSIWQAYHQRVWLHVSIHSGNTVKCSSGWKMTIDPAKWGWVLSNGSLLPIPSDLPSVPDKVLWVVSCSCKTDCNHGCIIDKYKYPAPSYLIVWDFHAQMHWNLIHFWKTNLKKWLWETVNKWLLRDCANACSREANFKMWPDLEKYVFLYHLGLVLKRHNDIIV